MSRSSASTIEMERTYPGLIDVWDASTFDEKLMRLLVLRQDLIRDYLTTRHKIFLSHDLGPGSARSTLRPQNRYAAAFAAIEEEMSEHMHSRTLRAWHYTRLTETEVEIMLRDGIYLSTPASLRARLDARVAASELTQDVADRLYAASPFHSDQREARLGKFWMTSHPVVIDDSGVVPLMARWGGEVAAMWTDDTTLRTPLASVGRPRVIEVAVPLSLTHHGYSAGQAVIATFGRRLGCIPHKHNFDLYVCASLDGDAILAIHSQGDKVFTTIGRNYPYGYIDTNIGRWKELTGEEE
jgi:hypothetical protein